MTFTIPFIHDALGQSVIYDEYRGDFAQARQLADEALAKARQIDHPTRLADALLARGVVHLLQGESVAAQTCFEQVEALTIADSARQLRAATYANLATRLHFALFPDGSSDTATEIEARWDGVAYSKQNSPRREALLAQIHDPALRLEVKLIDELQVNVLAARGFVSSSRGERATMFEQLLETALSIPEAFRQEARASGAQAGLLAYAELIAADLCWRSDRQERARAYLAQATALYQQAGDSAGMAICQMKRGDWLSAPLSSPLLWNYLCKEGTGDNSLSWTIEKAEFDGSPVDIEGAQAAYAKARPLFSAAGARRGLAALQLRYGYLAALKGDYNQAIVYASRAQFVFKQLGDSLGAWVAAAHHMLSLVGLGRFTETNKKAAALGTWGREQGSFSFTLGLGLLFNRAARYWLLHQGDYQRALLCHRLAETVFRELGASNNVALSLVGQGIVYQTIGEPYSAAATYEQAREVYAEMPALEGMSRLRATHLEYEIYEIYQSHQDTDGMERTVKQLKARTEHPLSSIDLSMESWINAGSALLAGKQIKSVVETADVLIPRYRAVQARDAGNEVEAKHQFDLALKAARQAGGLSDVLQASVLAEQRRYSEAIALFQRYLNRGGANSGFMGQMATLIGSVFGEEGKNIATRQSWETHKLAAVFFTITKAYAEAKTHLQALEQMAGPEWWKGQPRPWEPLLDYGEVYAGLNRPITALRFYERAITELEAQRRTLSRDELKVALVSGLHAQRIYFGSACAALDAAQQTTERVERDRFVSRAFDYAERGKARALLDLMSGSVLMAEESLAPKSEAINKWRQLNAQLTTWRGLLAGERGQDKPDQNRIAMLKKRLEADQVAQEQVEATLAATDPNFYQVINPQVEAISLDEVSHALPPKTALLQYYFLGRDLLIWAITNEGVQQTHHAKIDTKAMERQIRAFHRACEARGGLDRLGSELAQTLLAPLAEVIEEYTRLIIVPYGAAHVLPFDVLPWKGQPLAATHTISYLPSASSLRFLRSGNLGNLSGRILAVGNPARMSYQPPLGGERQALSSLPAAATEAAFVASLFQSEALIGEQATEPAVRERLTTHSVLHFATHGHLSQEAPMLSSIMLAEGEALTVYELMGLRLDADLAVLSACRTALGETTGGDDVLGLTRGLLAAGARAVVVSLWPVNDVSTSLLMGNFYEHLQKGDLPAVALQAAQTYLRTLTADGIKKELDRLKSTLQKANVSASAQHPVEQERSARHSRPAGSAKSASHYSHPYFWAPFILVG